MPRKIISAFVVLAFLTTAVPVPGRAGEVLLPAPGARLTTSPAFMPPMILGLTVDAKDPLKFNFLIDQGDGGAIHESPLREEYTKLIKYFLASLTIPEKDLWVNLSPYEGQRIIPQAFGRTEMGRDLLGQDYVLKQITASLIYPESELGRKFWADVYKKAHEQYGTTNIPVNTFNKVWIVPDEAMVYEHAGSAFVVKSHLKVMLEEDYLALAKHQPPTRGHVPQNVSPGPLPSDPGLNTKAPQGNPLNASPEINALGSQVVREVILPTLEKEVNEGGNFALLRQINNTLILATWYKRALKESLLGKFYVDKSKISGLEYATPTRGHVPQNVSPSRLPTNQVLNAKAPEGTNDIEYIYNQYLQAFKKGVYNYIREEADPYTRQTVPRKYFSGGFEGKYTQVVQVTGNAADVPAAFAERMSSAVPSGRIVDVAMRAEEPATAKDEAMISEEMKRENSKYRILIVDDLTSLSGLYARVLSRDGYQVETAINGEEALHKIRSNPGRYSFVFSDFEMPVMDGVELARRLQAEFPAIKMAINTSKPDEVKEAVVGLANVNNRVHFKATVANIVAVLEEDKPSFRDREAAGSQTPADTAMTGSSRLRLVASAGGTADFTRDSLLGVSELKDWLADGLRRIQTEWEALKTGDSRPKEWRIARAEAMSEAAGKLLGDYSRLLQRAQDPFLQELRPILTNGGANSEYSVAKFVGEIRSVGNSIRDLKDGESIPRGVFSAADAALAQGQRTLGFLKEIARRPLSPPDRAMAADQKAYRILFVDDDPGARETALMWFKLPDYEAYEVEAAVSGEDALAKISADPKRYSVVISDWNMTPEMNGGQLISRVRAMEQERGVTRPLPFIVQTTDMEVFEPRALAVVDKDMDNIVAALKKNEGSQSILPVDAVMNTRVINDPVELKPAQEFAAEFNTRLNGLLGQTQTLRQPGLTVPVLEWVRNEIYAFGDWLDKEKLKRDQGIDAVRQTMNGHITFADGRKIGSDLDIVNPLMVVASTAQMLEKDLTSAERRQSLIEAIDEAGKRMPKVFDLLSAVAPARSLDLVEVSNGRWVLDLTTLEGFDFAMSAVATKTPGGIDLNPANLNLRIKRDGSTGSPQAAKGVPLPVGRQDLPAGRQDMGQLNNIEGLVPVIIKIVPATHIPALSELLSTVN